MGDRRAHDKRTFDWIIAPVLSRGP